MFEHEHPLSLIDLWSKNKHNEEETDEDDVNDDDGDDVDYTKQDFRCQCDLCDKEINWFHRYYYKCDQCRYSIHKFCAELPETLQYPSHVCRYRHHHLILQRFEYYWKCYVCTTSHKPNELLYRCPKCYFKIDLHCATRYLKTNTIHHPSHLHPLVCVVEEILSKCHACGKKHEGIFYQCATCPIPLLHSDCAFLPKNLSIQQYTNDIFSHTHPLTLAYSFVIEDDIARSYTKCRVCNDRFDYYKDDYYIGSLWIYKCDRCRYYAHLDCATARHAPSPGMGRLVKNFKDDDYPHLVRLPFPNQTMNLIKHLFSKQNESSTSETGEAKQTHISHQHPLILVDTTKSTSSTLSCHDPMKKVELICDGCVRPIMDSPFYTCADEDEHHCNFALHEWCTQLPSEIKDHPGHPKHTLVFMPKVPYKPFGVFECDVCSYHCNGFVYCCVSCKYKVDVCCAFIPEKITHKAHQNHLLSRVTKILLGDDRCRLCFWGIGLDRFSFSCQDCGFHLHPGCALLLSETIRHKYDKHPYKLSYLPIENHKGDYFCDICEEQFLPEFEGSFYHCEKCVQSMHPACSMPIFRHKNPTPRSSSGTSFYRNVHGYVNIKFGGRLKSESHPHPLSFVQGLTSDGQCAKCNNGLENKMIFKCLQCEFVIHYDCLS